MCCGLPSAESAVVYYGATQVEAQICPNEQVAVVGAYRRPRWDALPRNRKTVASRRRRVPRWYFRPEPAYPLR